jgi:hypothetical protein
MKNKVDYLKDERINIEFHSAAGQRHLMHDIGTQRMA